MTPFVVFAVQWFYVAMLGLQSRHVRDGQYAPAALTSAVLGCCGLYLTSSIARLAVQHCDPWTILAYVLAGPCGIVVAMWGHNRYSTARQWKPDQLCNGSCAGRCSRERNPERDSAVSDSAGR